MDFSEKHYFIRVIPFWSVLAAVLLVGVRTRAEEPIITSFQNGYLSWTNVDPDLYYTVESRPNLTGSNIWDGSHRDSQDIQTNEDIITVPVGVFYRVVGSTNPMHTLMDAIDSTARDFASNAQAAANGAYLLASNAIPKSDPVVYTNHHGNLTIAGNLIVPQQLEYCTVLGITNNGTNVSFADGFEKTYRYGGVNGTAYWCGNDENDNVVRVEGDHIFIGQWDMAEGTNDWWFRFDGTNWMDWETNPIVANIAFRNDFSIGKIYADGSEMSGVAKPGLVVPYIGAESNLDIGNKQVTSSNSVNVNTNNGLYCIPGVGAARVGLTMVDRGIYISRKATNNPSMTESGFVALGFNIHANNRAALWLSAAKDTNSDNCADIYFGHGTNTGSAAMDWVISSRYLNLTNGHDAGHSFLINQSSGSGAPSSIRLKFTTNYEAMVGGYAPFGTAPEPNATFTVTDTGRDALEVIRTSTNAGTVNMAGIIFKSGTNRFCMTFRDSDDTFRLVQQAGVEPMTVSNGVVTIKRLIVGTNVAVSNWPTRADAYSGTVTRVLMNGQTNSPDGSGLVDLGRISEPIQSSFPLTCAPTVTVTKADIQAAPGGELRLTLTCTVQKFTFQMDTFDPYDAGTWTIAITTGSNTITADTNTLQGWDAIVWTNSATVPNDILFRKASGVTNAVKVLGVW